MKTLLHRPRRMRACPRLRALVAETRLSVSDLVMPLFVREGSAPSKPIASMPGHFQLNLKDLLKEAKEIAGLGIPAVLLFGIPLHKDEQGSQAYDDNAIVQQAVRLLKKRLPKLVVICDVCLCEFTSTGHCGLLKGTGAHATVDNDRTLDLLAKTAVSYAKAGSDMVAPSAMMDGQVAAIRKALDKAGFTDLPVMAYSAKYASAFYGPFRQAAESAPAFGDRRSYQMDCPNSREALREVALDVKEGADIVMVKPALAYLDIIAKVRQSCHLPVAAYNVSGEFSMVQAAAQKGWVDGPRIAMEILTAIKRSGADIIITYHAKEAARLLKKR